MPSNWLIFDRIRAFTRQHKIYRTERIYQDQHHLDRLATGGDFLDFNQQTAILDQTNLQINRLERYRDYEQMDQTGEISLALDLYADEASLVDPERKHTIIIRARNRRLKRELEELFFNTLQWDAYCRPSIRYLCKYGDMPFEVILDANRTGVSAMKFMNIYNFTRVETRYGDLVGFFYTDATLSRPVFLHPWQVVHLRLTSFENIYHPYGRCCDLDSFVTTPSGRKRLRDIEVDDHVMAWDGHMTIPARVMAVAHSGAKKTLTIRTRHHDIRLTPEHPVLVVTADRLKHERYAHGHDADIQCWMLARDLRTGDGLVVPRHDRPCHVEEVIEVADGGIVEVGDIQVEGRANFICNGIVVHNSILDGGRKAFKQLRLMEDAALIYRITRAPEKRKFIIPVGLIPPKEVPEYMQMIARNFKRQRFYNPSTGTFDERYSPLIQEDDFFLPRRPDGTGPDIDVLPGGENMDKIADIEYFKKKMIAPLKVPFARVGLGDNAGEASSKSLSQSHAEFAKAVQWVQREVATGLTKVAIIHLALRNFPVDDLKGFEIAMTATSAIEELYRIETWQTRVSVMADLKDLGWFPKEWIVTHFTDLSPDEIEELKDMEIEATGGEGGPSLDIPADTEIEAAMDTDEEKERLEGGEGEMVRTEGYDWEADRRLIHELKRQGKIARAMNIIRKWADRLGKAQFSERREFTNGYQHILETKELDGLSRTVPGNGRRTDDDGNPIIHDPNKDPGLLVEWSVPSDIRNEAISETYNVITAGENLIINDDDTITEADLPA